MHVYSLKVAQPAEAKPAPASIATVRPESAIPPPRTSGWSSRWPALAPIAALLFLVAAGGWTIPRRPPDAPSKPRISPCRTALRQSLRRSRPRLFRRRHNGKPHHGLSRIHDSFVIARNTAFASKGKPIDAKEIGKELGIRYVLEGSVQRDQNRVRVNAQLIDTQIRSASLGRPVRGGRGRPFKLQDQVVARLASRLGYELVKAEAAKGAGWTNPDADDLVMRGLALINEGSSQPTKERNIAARTLFGQALAIDPNNPAAIAGFGFQLFPGVHLG